MPTLFWGPAEALLNRFWSFGPYDHIIYRANGRSEGRTGREYLPFHIYYDKTRGFFFFFLNVFSY